jgi:hypothetical protein
VRLVQRQEGVSWQITPRVLTRALAAGGEEARCGFNAMMDMKKIDVAAIDAARFMSLWALALCTPMEPRPNIAAASAPGDCWSENGAP